jgi:outer membrane receptor for ferrienterochelin and colicin
MNFSTASHAVWAKSLQRRWLSGSVDNLFNESYGDPGAEEHRQDIIKQDGRTFWLKLKYSF